MKPGKRTIWKLILGIVAASIVYGAIVYWIAGCVGKAGTFGDMFGGFNALFAAISSVGVVLALFAQQEQLLLQREELAQQREELKLQREEMAGSRQELQNQALLQKKQLQATIVQLHLECMKTESQADELTATVVHGRADSYSNMIRARAQQMRTEVEKLEQAVGLI